MKIYQTDFSGNGNIGLYGFVTDSFGLIGPVVKPVLFEKLKKIFDVPLYQVTIAGTSLLGVFIAGNSECIIVPSIIDEDEKKILDEIGIKYVVSDINFTAFGNLIVSDESNTLVSPEFKDTDLAFFEENLGTSVVDCKIGKLETVGGLIVIGKDKILASSIIYPDQKEILEEHFGKEVIVGNLQESPYVKASILINKNGAVISKGIKGQEMFIVKEFIGE